MTTEAWGSDIEIERHLRIMATIWAYAYEFMADSLVPDHAYDEVVRMINPKVKTGHEVLDEFFQNWFSPDSGMWIRLHPELDKVDQAYKRLKKILEDK